MCNMIQSYFTICLLLAYLQVVLAVHPWMFGRRSQIFLSPETLLETTTERVEGSSGPKHDTAGEPNLATRIEVTSQPNASLWCATDEDKFISGYAHFTNSIGIEDKHMFWWLFEAREDPANAPLVLIFGGGSGSSGMFMPFNGAGPCRLAAGNDGNGTALPSQYPWTQYANVLAIDHPVGVGFSYGPQSSLRNSSERASWDVDDFLQAFWSAYPHFFKNQFAVQSASYGGTYIPHLVNAIYSRNVAAQKNSEHRARIQKMPDAVMIGNGWSDPVTNFRWYAQTYCIDQQLSNETECAAFTSIVPACLDTLQFAYEQPSLKNLLEAQNVCVRGLEGQIRAHGRNPYDSRQTCNVYDLYDCFPQMGWMNDLMARTDVREAIGIPDHIEYTYLAEEAIGRPFTLNGDLIQPSYKLLGPAIRAGLRVLVYNGNRDAICSWRSNLAWMGLLQSVHQTAFRTAPDELIPGIGWTRKVGGGAGVYTFLSVDEAGHFVEWNQPKVFRNILVNWLKNETFGSEI